MKKLLLLTKTILVAMLLGVGTSAAWGQTTAFSQDFTAIDESTDPADYGFTMTTYNDGAATVTGGLLQYSLPANSSKDVSAWGAASFTAIPTGNVVTVSCSWNPGGPTGTRPYSCLRVYGSNGTEDKVVFSLYNNGQTRNLLLRSSEAETEDANVLVKDNSDWRSGSNVWNVVAVLNLNTQKVTSLTVTKSGASTPAVSASAIDFENEVVNINKFEFGTNKKSNYLCTSTLDNVSITYEAAASTADVTFKYKDTSDNDLSSIKADVVESNDVGASVADVITSALKTSFYNGDESTRYDYSTFTCSDETVPAGGTTVTLKFAPKAKYTYTVKAVDGSDNPLATIATATAYAGDASNLVWSKYVKVDDQWYVTSESTFATSVTAGGNKNVVYATSDIAYFYEMEGLTRSGGAYLTEENNSYSGKYRLRISKGSMHYTPALSAGVYTLKIGVANSNSSTSEVYVYTRSASGNLSEVLYTHTANSGTSTLNTIITVPEGYSIAFNGNEGSSNNNARMDYMTLTKITSVSATITAYGYATFSSTYALDFTDVDNATAWIVTGKNGNAVTMEQVTGTVAAGTGLILKSNDGSAANVTIPVVATGDEKSGNKLWAINTDQNVPAAGTGYTNYVLSVQGEEPNEKVVFAPIGANAAPAKAGQAALCLPNSSGSSRVLFISFDNESTSIESVKNGGSANAPVYNLQGQRIAKPMKGLYIENGKIVVKK